MKYYILFTVFLYSLAVFAQNIKILTWWDYIPESTLVELKARNKIEISIFKSNEESIARILRSPQQYDIAIISNQAVLSLQNEGIKFKKIKDNKLNYITELQDIINHSCIPYLWSTSILFNNSNKYFNSLQELIKDSNKNNSNLILIDDPSEIYARKVVEFSNCKEGNKLFTDKDKCSNSNGILEKSKNVLFQTDLSTLENSKLYGYGWSGEIITHLSKTKNVVYSIPKKSPTIGVDYVCVLNKKDIVADKLLAINRIVNKITSIKSITINVDKYKYFAPFVDYKYKDKTLMELNRLTLEKIKEKNYLFIDSPSINQLKALNSWWREIRYETKP